MLSKKNDTCSATAGEFACRKESRHLVYGFLVVCGFIGDVDSRSWPMGKHARLVVNIYFIPKEQGQRGSLERDSRIERCKGRLEIFVLSSKSKGSA